MLVEITIVVLLLLEATIVLALCLAFLACMRGLRKLRMHHRTRTRRRGTRHGGERLVFRCTVANCFDATGL